jgi:glycosyltransferase involved in cell wall biosynthesis
MAPIPGPRARFIKDKESACATSGHGPATLPATASDWARYIRPMPDTNGRRIFLVTNEILGVVKTGGSGTANTFLSFALTQLGYQVELLITAPSGPVQLDPAWAKRYDERGIAVRLLPTPAKGFEPRAFALPATVLPVLESEAPDIVVADAWSAPAYTALRLRDLGLVFDQTTFVVVCNGPTAWAYETDRKLPRSFPAFELEAIERMSIELADAVVSPSRFLLQWMQDRGWQLPQSFVAPYFTQSTADGVSVTPAATAKLKRLAFFGRFEERKGLRPFLDAINGLEPGLLTGVELAFVGRETSQWPVEQIVRTISNRVKPSVRGLRIETGLDQPEAIAFLKEPGTLAVMPSLLDNSPNVVYECLEHGIPFLASNASGAPELVDEEDRARAFVDPSAGAIRCALEQLLAQNGSLRPARASFSAEEIFGTWRQALASEPTKKARPRADESIAALLVTKEGSDGLERCLDALAAQTLPPQEVVVVSGDGAQVDLEERPWPWQLSIAKASATVARETGLRLATSELVVLLEDTDVLDANCLDVLARAQRSSRADVVTCALRRSDSESEIQFFLGEPHELGLVGNYYGLVALCRRDVLANSERPPETGGDTDWVLFASLSRSGARIVSIPSAFGQTRRLPGNQVTDPIGSGAALEVVRMFERTALSDLRGLPRLAASLAARRTPSAVAPSVGARLGWIWQHEGARGLRRRLAELSSDLLRRFVARPLRADGAPLQPTRSASAGPDSLRRTEEHANVTEA